MDFFCILFRITTVTAAVGAVSASLPSCSTSQNSIILYRRHVVTTVPSTRLIPTTVLSVTALRGQRRSEQRLLAKNVWRKRRDLGKDTGSWPAQYECEPTEKKDNRLYRNWHAVRNVNRKMIENRHRICLRLTNKLRNPSFFGRRRPYDIVRHVFFSLTNRFTL